MTAARDLAATDALVARAQRGLRASRDRRGERDAEIIRDLAVEGLQAMDDIAVELRRIAALERQAADAQERAVRAEEALRHMRDFLAENAPAEWDGGDLGYMVGGLCSEADEVLAAAGADTPPELDEMVCDRCHRRHGVVWYAPSDVWNLVMRGGERGAPDEYGFCCPICFIQLAGERGIDATGWLVSPDLRAGADTP